MQSDTLAQNENITLVKQLYRAFAAQDIGRLLEVLDDEIDWLFYGPEEIPFAGHYCGREQVAAFFAKAQESLEFITFEPQEFVSGSNNVLVQGFEKGRAKSTGRTWETQWAHVFTLRHGKIVKLREYYDTAVVVAAFRAE